MPNTNRTALSPIAAIAAIALVTTTLSLGACAGGGGSNDRIYGEDGFYFDRSVNQWRDPDGEICHSCTPENGFEDYSR
jgi:hypothetical protein